MIRVTLLAALAFGGAAFAQAPEAAKTATPPAEAAAPPNATPKDDERVCRVERVTGSRLAKTRVCRTRAEWRASDDQKRGDVDDTLRRANVSTAPPAS